MEASTSTLRLQDVLLEKCDVTSPLFDLTENEHVCLCECVFLRGWIHQIRLVPCAASAAARSAVHVCHKTLSSWTFSVDSLIRSYNTHIPPPAAKVKPREE